MKAEDWIWYVVNDSFKENVLKLLSGRGWISAKYTEKVVKSKLSDEFIDDED